MGQKYTEPVVRKIVEADTNHEYSLIDMDLVGKKDEETGKTKKREMTVKHNHCGHTYTLDLYEFCSDGTRRCGKCKGIGLSEQNSEDIEVIKLQTDELTEGEYSFIDGHYTNSKTKHIFLHKTCGTKFKKTWDKFSSGQRCTECYRKGMESMASRYVRDILDALGVIYDCEKRFDDCINPETVKTLPFDYYLPEINTLIEVDGEQHERGSFTKYDHIGTVIRDKIKNRYAEEKEIELVRIPAKKWSLLPEFLFEILSKNLIPTLTLEEVKEIPHSTHPERVNKDLEKVHNSEYSLYDPYYFGVDRVHNFKHITCGAVFSHTVYRVKTEKYPCPACKEDNLKKDNHDTFNQKLKKKSQGRYSLDDSHIGIDEKGRRLTHCSGCNNSWWVTVGNLMKDTAGCPTCLELKKDKEWKVKYDLVVMGTHNGKTLSKPLKNWIWVNLKRYKDGKLKEDRVQLLKKATLL